MRAEEIIVPMKLKSFFSGLILTFICLTVLVVAVSAQGKLSEVRIYSVDSAQFPQMRVRVAPLQADGTLAPGLGREAFRIYEDGAERPVESASPIERGAQIAFVLDASGSINSPGATKRLRREEAIEAIDDLVMTDKWVNRSSRLDRWMLIVPKGEKDLRVAQEWTDQPIAIHNGAYSYDYRSQTGDTPLYAMLVEALARMKDVPDYEARPKFLVVLSDGVDRTSKSDITDVINRANKLEPGVKIISIKLGPEAEGATSNLYRLAKETDGVLVAPYTGPDALRDAYGRLKSQRSPYEITYRSALGVSGKHAVVVGVLIGGQEVRSASAEFSTTVEPPAVRIVEPASPAIIERVGDRWDADPKTLSPRDVPVAVEITWPGGRARAVQQITYLVDGVPVSSLKPEQRFVWDFSALPDGPHALVVEVKDELGVIARSEPLQANISIILPPAPTPTPLAPVIKEVIIQETSKFGMFSAVALGIAAIALLLAIYVMIKYRVPQRVGSAIGDVAKAVTDPFIHRQKGTPRRARATLVLLKEDGAPGETFALQGQKTIGRNPESAQIIISHPTVSKLHARIEEETTGVFKIFDEGSTHGTYVNDEPVGPGGASLKARDEIELGDVRLLFQPGPLQSIDQTEPSARSEKRKARSGKSETPDKDDTIPEVRLKER
jgi:hypothetical protein